MHVFGVMNFVLGHKEKTDGQEQRSGVDLSKEDQPGSSPLGASGHPSPQSGSALKSGCEEEKGSSSPPSPRASGHPSGSVTQTEPVRPASVSKSPLPENFLTGAALDEYLRLREAVLADED